MVLGRVPGNLGGWRRSPLGFMMVVRAKEMGEQCRKAGERTLKVNVTGDAAQRRADGDSRT